uniref:Putative secreted protein n=1 Tax=Ixodes ricinus TaxID=34613 RepID=A0A6B0U256_IXORI
MLLRRFFCLCALNHNDLACADAGPGSQRTAMSWIHLFVQTFLVRSFLGRGQAKASSTVGAPLWHIDGILLHDAALVVSFQVRLRAIHSVTVL